jgi:hypothetical protein
MRVFLTLLATGVAAVLLAPSALADSTTTLSLCAPLPDPPCVVSVKRNGLDIPYNASPGGADDVVYATKFHFTGDPTKHFYFNIAAPDGSWTLDTSDTYEISLNLGSADPGETFERGHDVTITRNLSDPSNQIITFTQNPVLVADQGCNSMGSCDPVAGRTLTGYSDGWIDDLAFIDDPLDRASMRGYDFATSADWSSSPPTLNYDTHTFILDIGNAHFLHDGTTRFIGSAEFRFPFAMLSRLYEVDDPASLTAGSFTISGTGAAATSTVDIDSGGHVVHVTIEGMTFSKHRVKIVGDMRPGGVRNLKAVRVSRTAGKLKFDPAASHGSKVRGYKATCKSDSGLSATGSADASPLKITGLAAGVKYRCTVRAKSRFGDGPKRGADLPRS